MKKNGLNLIIVALIFFNFFSLFKISSLENSLDRRLSYYENTISNLENQISGIYSNVDTKLKKQVSILDSHNITFGDKLNKDDLTVEVTFSTTPKEYSDSLKATLQLNDKNIEMEKKGTSFEVSTNAYIFEPFQAKVILEQNEIQKIETLEEYFDLQYKYILDIHSGYGGNESYGSGKYKYDGEINISFGSQQYNSPKKISIIKEINGVNIGEQAVTYSEPLIVPVKDEVEIGANDKFALYAYIEDEYGLKYKYIILAHDIDKDGKPVRSYPEWTNGSVTEISDKNGNVLFAPKYLME